MTSVHQAFAAVMAEVQGLGKHQRNTAPNGNYNFRGIDAVMNAVGPALRNHKVIITPNVRKVTKGTTTTSKGHLMTTVDVEVEFTIYGPDGDSIVTSAPGEAFDSGDKATSKAMSVAYRTMLLQSMCLPTDEPDPDSHSYDQVDPRQQLNDAKRAVWAAAAKVHQGDDADRKSFITAALATRGIDDDDTAGLTALAEEWSK